jgi:hypothetical protein
LVTGQVYKSQAGAVENQLRDVTRHTGWTPGQNGDPALHEIAWGAPHDQMDAYLSAWVASLEEPDRVCFGVPPHDAIWIPRLPSPSTELPTTPIAVEPAVPPILLEPVALANPADVVLCPGRGQKEFKRGPWGWDVHAAHDCAGLEASGPEERKAEFRLRFAGYFRPFGRR